MTTREFMALTKALADENRIRIFLALKDQELCVCQITELMGLAPSTTSKHLPNYASGSAKTESAFPLHRELLP
jgi:DNA-binding transcriptional ArsR family regulator